jgi:subtilisin family serine protease
MPMTRNLNESTHLNLLIHLLLSLLLLFGVSAPSAQGAASGLDPQPTPEFVPGRVIVKLKPVGAPASQAQAAASSTLAALLARSEVASAGPLFTGPFSDPGLALEIGLERIYLLELQEGLDIFAVIDALANDPAVEYAEADYIMAAATDDDYFDQQWGLHNTGQFIDGRYPGIGEEDADIDMPEAWEISKGSQDIIIAMVDSGVDTYHPDLASKLVAGYNVITKDNIPEDDCGQDQQRYWHSRGVLGMPDHAC